MSIGEQIFKEIQKLSKEYTLVSLLHTQLKYDKLNSLSNLSDVDLIDYDEILDTPTSNITPVKINTVSTKLPSIKISNDIYDVILNIDGNKLVNKHGEVLGEISIWIDEKNRIPRKYKNNNNEVTLDQTILHKYYLYESIYHELPSKYYKEYKYDSALDKFVKTGFITKI
jgi:hypothetical protein